MLNVAITGCTSFLGQYVVNELLKYNVHIFAIIRPESKHLSSFENISNVTIIQSDMKNVEKWSKEIQNIDYFLHLGWDGSGVTGRADEVIQNSNVECTSQIFECVVKKGCKCFLFTGSQAEYGIHNDVITEDTPCNPITPYGKSKLKVLNELLKLSKEYKIKYYHSRVFSVYGVGDHPWTLISKCIEKLPKSESMQLTSCTQYWNYIYASDAAKEIVSLLFSDAESGVYNIASNDTRPLKDFVYQIHDLCDNKGALLFDEYIPSEGITQLKPDISKILSICDDISFTPFDIGIKNILDDEI